MSDTPSDRPTPLEGDIKAFPLADVLRFLALSGKTGILTCRRGPRQIDLMGQRGRRQIELTIKEGRICGGGPDRWWDALCRYLAAKGKVSRTRLMGLFQFRGPDDDARGAVHYLLEHGLAEREEIDAAIQRQIAEDLLELFDWPEGEFKFRDETAASEEGIDASLPIEPLIEESRRRLEQWQAIRARLPMGGMVYRATAESAPTVGDTLEPGVWHVLALINGRRDAEALIDLSGLGRHETLRALDALVARDWIEAVPLEQPQEPAAPMDQPPERKGALLTSDKPGDTRGGIASLLGIGRKAASTDPSATSGATAKSASAAVTAAAYQTGAALACAALNQALEHLQRVNQPARPDSACDPATIWALALAQYPQGDLVVIQDGRWTAQRLERYLVAAGGMDASLAGCHEETLEALAEAGRLLAYRATEQWGVRAQGLIADAVGALTEQATAEHPAGFDARAWRAQWLNAGS